MYLNVKVRLCVGVMVAPANNGNPVRLKRELLKVIQKRLKGKELKVARGDWHSKRKPIGCGLTIHPGIGCPVGCSYCYIYDMGFSWQAAPYSLNGLQLVAALLFNKYFYPTKWGTYLAFGSVTEPFLPSVLPKTLEYLRAVGEYLGNPCQVSTKMVINDEHVDELARITGSKLSILVTVTSLSQYAHLERRAPHPLKRLELVSRLRSKGFKPFVFIRPLLPGLRVEEVDEIAELAKASGAYGIVVGNLRLSLNIVRRLMREGIDVAKHLKIDLGKLKRGFVDVRVDGALQSLIREGALKKGLIFLKRACCANTVSQLLSGYDDVVCPSLCFLNEQSCEKSCPARCRIRARGEPRHLDFDEVMREVLGSDEYEVEVEDHTLCAKLKRPLRDEKLASFALSYLFRRRVRFVKRF
jgi:DNA repair photolyase